MRLYDARHRHGDGGPPTMLLNQNETKETCVAANIVQSGSAPWPGASDPYAAWLAQDSRVEQDPTVRLIRRKATELGRTVEVTELIAEGAFEAVSAATARSTTRFLKGRSSSSPIRSTSWCLHKCQRSVLFRRWAHCLCRCFQARVVALKRFNAR